MHCLLPSLPGPLTAMSDRERFYLWLAHFPRQQGPDWFA